MQKKITMMGGKSAFYLSLLFGGANGVPLLGGRFVTTTDVRGILDFSLDMEAMEGNNNPQEREQIYKHGQNAYVIDPDSGERQNISLASLSVGASSTMYDDASFVLFVQYFQSRGSINGEEPGQFAGRPASEYADAIVTETIGQDDASYETEAIRILNVWMAVIHELHEVIRGCHHYHNKTMGLAALDNAIALWVGGGQSTGSDVDGRMLYRLAEVAGARFGREDDSGESWVNRHIIEVANSLQTDLSTGIVCTPQVESTVVREKVTQILTAMSIPLIQNEIYYVMTQATETSADYAKLYSSAVLPKIAACDASKANLLQVDSFLSMTLPERVYWVTRLQNTLSCFQLSCADIGFHDDPDFPECNDTPTLAVLAGYAASSPESQHLSFIDRDVYQMQILMRADALEAANDVYKNGYNSRHSLQQLALNRVIPTPTHSTFNLFQMYYGSADNGFIDNEIQAVLGRDAKYESATTDQKLEIVLGLLKFQALYLSVESAFAYAVEECQIENYESASSYWDMGAAFYIGSYEGSAPGGGTGGLLLHGSSKRLCHKFGTCESDTGRNNSQSIIIDALSMGNNLIVSQDCQAVQTLYEEYISPFLKVPLIQGTVSAGLDAELLPEGSDDGVIGLAHAFSRSILPFVNEVSENSATTIDRNLGYNGGGKAIPDGMDVVAEALRRVLPFDGLNCSDFGTLTSPPLDFCEVVARTPDSNEEMLGEFSSPGGDNVPGIQNSTGTATDLQIAFGRYNFSYPEPANRYASLAFDIRDMVRANTTADAQQIYKEGSNSLRPPTDESGWLSLASFSTDAANVMSEDPMFNIFKYALYSDEVLESAQEMAFTYADEIVTEALESAYDSELASEAAVILNVWMMIAHQLYNAERSCRQQANAEEHVDMAVALWIGKGQAEGAFDEGWLLYSLAQEAAQGFGFNESEAIVNTQLMSQFVEIQSLARQCPEDASMADIVRVKVSELLRSLSVPLVQHLLISIAADDEWHTELYASAVVSQCAGCSPDLHASLAEVLYSGFSIEKVDEHVLESLALFLRCIRISCEDLEMSPAAMPELRKIVSSICQVLDSKENDSSLMGYEPKNSVYEQARIDLDVLQIGIFMRTRAYDAALDLFENGQNSFAMRAIDASSEYETTLTSLTSLKKVLQVPDMLDVGHLDIFSEYFGSNTYAEDIVTQCFQRSGPFQNATRTQLSDAATRALQTFVAYKAVVVQLVSAVKVCRERGARGASHDWDGGAAILVGSIDSFFSTGRSRNGDTLYSLVLEQCSLFDSCSQTSEVDSTSALLSLLQDGNQLLQDGRCNDVEELVNSEMLPLMQIPLIQGTLSQAFTNSRAWSATKMFSTGSTAEGYIFAHSILPLVDASNEESAEALANVFDSLDVDSGSQEEVFEAVRRALPGMGIGCDEIGMLEGRPDLSLCVAYNLPSGFENYAAFGLDIAAMRNALSRGQDEQARNIYSQGTNVLRNAVRQNDSPIDYKSLQSLSTLATKEMVDEPAFNLFLFHFDGGAERAKSAEYADTFVQEAFAASSVEATTLAADAALVLNVWMYFIHNLYKSLASCREGLGAQKAIDAVDQAAAFWIGDFGLTESDPNGNLLYSLAAFMGSQFELEFFPYDLNQEVLGRLQEVKDYLEEPNECSAETSSFSRRFELANEVSSLATVPIVQGLVHYLRAGDSARSKLFATALVPLLTVCKRDDYNFLKAKLLDEDINLAEVDTIIDTIYDTLPCLGLKCTQVGIHLSEILGGFTSHPRCEIVANQTSSIVGYRPNAQFWKYAPLDLDMSEVDILMQRQAYSAVRDILFYGKHASVSTIGIASSPGRKDIPSYNMFSDYFDSMNYGHDLIVDAVDNSVDSLTSAQQRVFVVRFTQAMALEQAALEMVYSSIEACENGGSHEEMHEPWDAAAGLLLGSINRTVSANASTSLWYAPFDLAQEYCGEFQTCGSDGFAQANKQMLELLYAGRGAAMVGSGCGVLRKIAGELTALLLVPVIQATLSASIRLSSTASEEDQTPEDLAKAFVFSRVVLPRIQSIDAAVAGAMEDTLTLKSKSISKSTGEYMFALFHSVYEDLGVDCEAIGTTEEFDACKAPPPGTIPTDDEDATSSSGLVVGLATAAAVLFVIVLAALYCVWRRRRLSKKNRTNLSRGSNALLSSSLTSRPPSFRDIPVSPLSASFRSTKPLSSKASGLLDLILSYGDDETVDGRNSMSVKDECTGFLTSKTNNNDDTFNVAELSVMDEENGEECQSEISATDTPSTTGSDRPRPTGGGGGLQP